MHVAMAAIADAANVSQEGKLNITGIFDTISASSFPSTHPALAFAFRLRVEFEDQQKEHQVDISVIDQDGQALWTASGKVGVGRIEPGDFKHVNQVANVHMARFPKPGRYRFRITIEGQDRPHDTVFRVLMRPAPPSQNPPGKA